MYISSFLLKSVVCVSVHLHFGSGDDQHTSLYPDGYGTVPHNDGQPHSIYTHRRTLHRWQSGKDTTSGRVCTVHAVICGL